MKLFFKSPAETKKFAEKLAGLLKGGEVVFLIGNLGSGKTYFTKMLAEAIGVSRKVKSPTFVLFRKYSGNELNLYHFDLYRLENSEEEIDIDEIGLSEALDDISAVTVIEWADLLKNQKIKNRIELKFTMNGENGRDVEVDAYGSGYDELMEKLEKVN